MKIPEIYIKRWMIRVATSPRILRSYEGLIALHATKTGGPVLKGEGSIRNINGFMWSGNSGHVIVTFRRPSGLLDRDRRTK